MIRELVVLAAGTVAPGSDTCHGFGQLFNPIIQIIQIIESAPGAGSRAPSCLERELASFACNFGYLMSTRLCHIERVSIHAIISGQDIFGDELLPYWRRRACLLKVHKL